MIFVCFLNYMFASMEPILLLIWFVRLECLVYLHHLSIFILNYVRKLIFCIIGFSFMELIMFLPQS